MKILFDFKVDYLKKIDFFAQLKDEELAKLHSISSIKFYNKGEMIFYEKDILENIYYLKSGLVKLYKTDKFSKEIFLSNVSDNSLLYTVSNLSDDERMGAFYNVECIKECEVLTINAKSFKKLFFDNIEVLRKILEESYKNIKRFQDIIQRDIVFDGTSKVAFMIYNNLDNFNSLKKSEIAYLLHLRPETLCRILNKLTKQEIIEIKKGSIFIKESVKLREIFEY